MDLQKVISQYYYADLSNCYEKVKYKQTDKFARRWIIKDCQLEMSVYKLLGLPFQQFCHYLDAVCAEQWLLHGRAFDSITLHPKDQTVQEIKIGSQYLKGQNGSRNQLFAPPKQITESIFLAIGGPNTTVLCDRDEEWLDQAMFDFDCACLHHFYNLKKREFQFEAKVWTDVSLQYNINREDIEKYNRDVVLDDEGTITRTIDHAWTLYC